MPEKQESNKTSKKKKSLPWFRGHHRLVVINDQTFQEERSWKLSLRSLILVTCSLFFGISLLTLLIVKFTPMKRIVSSNPGISDKELRKEMEKLYRDLDSLDRELKGNITYIESLKKLSSESFEYEKDIKKPEAPAKTATSSTFADIPKKSEEKNQLSVSDQNIISQGNLIQGDFFDQNSKIDKSSFGNPVRGVVSDRFAPSRGHYGTDVVAPKGTVIKATKSGTIIMSSWSSDTGHMIGIQHQGNLISWYKHNSANLKKLGDRVAAGEAIAIIGNSGEMSNGPHLHFELWYNGQAVDAEKYINF
jgi:murein DD-endopeptidase MepM/ murein hydrolase activator NlpD